jgi:acetyl esterase
MSELHVQEKALLRQMRQAGFRPASQIPLEESRQGLARMAVAMAAPKVSVGRIEDRRIPGPGGELPIRIYRPDREGQDSEPVALYFHGGGFYLGDLETHDHVCRFLCKAADIIVIAVNYRLAPENKFPAAVDDCYAALCWVSERGEAEGFDAKRIALVGDSAGGSLVASICFLARDRGGPRIGYQAMIYPALAMDDGADFPSRKALGSGEYFIAQEDFAFFRALYFHEPEKEMANPLASPIRAKDFSNLPPALIVAAEYDPCRDENEKYAELLKAAGVQVEYVCFEGTIHPFFLFDGVLDSGREGQALVADRVRRRLKR